MFAHPSRHHAARLFRVEPHEAWTIRTGLAKINIDYAMTHMAFTDPLKLDDWDAPRARSRAPERAYWGQANKVDRDSRFTPPEFMEAIYAGFGPVDLDPCANIHSPVIASVKSCSLKAVMD